MNSTKTKTNMHGYCKFNDKKGDVESLFEDNTRTNKSILKKESYKDTDWIAQKF